jgi:hypothetical protein
VQGCNDGQPTNGQHRLNTKQVAHRHLHTHKHTRSLGKFTFDEAPVTLRKSGWFCGIYPVSLWLPCGLLGFTEPTTVTVNEKETGRTHHPSTQRDEHEEALTMVMVVGGNDIWCVTWAWGGVSKHRGWQAPRLAALLSCYHICNLSSMCLCPPALPSSFTTTQEALANRHSLYCLVVSNMGGIILNASSICSTCVPAPVPAAGGMSADADGAGAAATNDDGVLLAAW